MGPEGAAVLAEALAINDDIHTVLLTGVHTFGIFPFFVLRNLDFFWNNICI